jgi:FkbM family methyltransferase
MLTREEVVWGYRYVLGREPESEHVIEIARGVADIAAFRSGLLASEEFAKTSKLLSSLDRWVLTPILGGQRLMWVNLSDKYVSFGCLLDNYEPAETRFVRKHLKGGDTFLDIGANIGWFTLLANSLVGPSGQDHAFEPHPIIGDYLGKTLEMNKLANVRLHRAGVFDEVLSADLAWSKNTDNFGGSFILRDQATTSDMRTQTVPLVSLDSLELGKVDFIKIDIEGAEMRAFKGGMHLLSKYRPVVLSELYPDQLQRVSNATAEEFFDLFKRLDYRCFVVDVNREGDEITGFPQDWYKPLLNVGFVPRERVAELHPE